MLGPLDFSLRSSRRAERAANVEHHEAAAGHPAWWAADAREPEDDYGHS